MRTRIAGLMLIATIELACSTSQEQGALLGRRAAIRASNDRNYRSPQGFQEARWGMTVEEVRAVFPEATPSGEGSFHMLTTIANIPASVTLGFLEGRFAAVDVVFSSLVDVRSHHDLLRDLLSRKYGRPSEELDTAWEAQRRVGQHRLAADLARAGAMTNAAISGGAPDPYSQARIDARAEQNEDVARERAREALENFTLQSRWATSESFVSLTGQQSRSAASLRIQYESAKYAPQLADVHKKAQDARRRSMAKDL